MAAAAKKDDDHSATVVPETVSPVGTPQASAPLPVATETEVLADRPAGGEADGDVVRPFDQTNGLTNLDGDSDGTAESDTRSAAERRDKPLL